MAEFDAGGVSAMLAADAQLDVGTGLPAEVCCHLYKLADANLIKACEGIALEDLLLIVIAEELACVVTAEAEGHLGEVVGAEAEEFSLGSNLVGGQRCAGDLDHGTYEIRNGHSLLFHDELCGGVNEALYICKLLGLADQGDHDLGNYLKTGLLTNLDSCLDDGTGLHLSDFGIGDGEAAAAVTHHGVALVEADNGVLELFEGDAHGFCQRPDVLILGGKELVEGGIQEADGNGTAFHCLVDALEVLALHGEDLCKSGLALVGILGDYHLTHCGDPCLVKEHMLGTAETDAFCAEPYGCCCLSGGVRIGADLEGTEGVRPLHDGCEIAGELCRNGLDSFGIDLAGGAVEAHPITLADNGTVGEGDGLACFVNGDGLAAADTAGAELASDDCGVAGHAAECGQDAFGCVHALDILGAGLLTGKDDLFAGLMSRLGFVSGEIDLAACCAGACCQAFSLGSCRLERRCVEGGMEKCIEGLGIDHLDGFLLGACALVYEIDCDLESGRCGALAVAGLEHVELAALDGELHILHIAIVLFKNAADADEFVIDLFIGLTEVIDVLGGADACNDVLALCVHQIFAEQQGCV